MSARLAIACALLTGCQPQLGGTLALVTAPRLLAVRCEPPEAPPGATVRMTALVAAQAGTVAAPALDWALCVTPKPSTENGAVSPDCLTPAGVVPLPAQPPIAEVALPSDGCRRFGPDVPPVAAGQPPVAPRAPDSTGGYYQPVRVDLGEAPSVVLERIRCNPPGASMELAAQYQAEYSPNRNPTSAPLSASIGGQPVALDAIPAGAMVALTVGWTANSAEPYPVIDVAEQLLVPRREAMSVSWYVTAGALRDERTGRTEGESQLDTTNAWAAPTAPGVVHLWAVLRDSRGGVDFADYTLAVVAR
jgi:hypothetical protein